MKRPSFQFYPADWRKDPALSACSLAARGLWIELMCIAHESEDYGYLTLNGNAMSDVQIARIVGEIPKYINSLLSELEEAGVFSRDERGAIFSRRMVKDENIRNVRAQSGRLGGNPNLVKQKVNRLDKQNGKQKTTPSSSSSSSSSEVLDTGEETNTSPAGEKTEFPPPHPPEPTIAGLACLAMREAGIANTNPMHVKLLALIEAGAPVEEFRQTAQEAIAMGKPNFSYVLGTMIGRRQDAADLKLHKGPLPSNQSDKSKKRSQTYANLTGKTGNNDGTVIDGTATRVD
jgi:hypothetical protein